MKILLVGNGQFYHIGAFFRRAIEALGHTCAFLDEDLYLRPLQTSLIHKGAFRLLGKRPLTYWALNHALRQLADDFQPHLLLTTNGAYIAAASLAAIKQKTGAILATYATDDPFNPINTTRDFVGNIPLYDFFFSTKRAIMADLQQAGGQNVCFIPFGYEPQLHYPEKARTAVEQSQFASDVVFIGSGDADRFPYMAALSQLQGVKLHLYGGYWERNPQLQPYYCGFALGRDFRLALAGTKIAPCLVRRANRDGHVMRTFEVPACGAFMLAEDTEDHRALFTEGKEAVFFNSVDELVEKVQYYLRHDEERERIRLSGYQRIVINGQHTYRHRLEAMLQQINRRGAA